MNYIKRALLSVWKHMARSLILTGLFFVISFLILISTCLSAASQSAVKNAKENIGAEVTISWDTTTAMNKKIDTVTPLGSDTLKRLSNIRYVKSYNYVSSSGYAVADGFSMFVDENEYQKGQEKVRQLFLAGGKPTLAKNWTEPNITLFGALDTAKTDQFLSGGYTLVSGRQIQPSDFGKQVAMVTQAVADKNHLKIGSKITIKASNDPSVKEQYTVVGIFYAPLSAYDDIRFAIKNPEDTIFVPYSETGLYCSGNTRYTLNDSVLTAKYFLDDPANVPIFEMQAKKILGTLNYKISSSENLYKEVILPMDGISRVAAVMGWSTGIIGCVILFLIILISIKGRNTEFGILLAMGEKKRRIIGQTMTEVLIPVIIAFILAISAANFSAARLGDKLSQGSIQSANQQITALEKSASVIYEQPNLDSDEAHGNPGIPQTAKPIDKINIVPSTADYGTLAIICLLITLVSVILPCIRILSFQPREILLKK